MKIKLKDLNANPFKKDINGGKLREDIIKKLMANMKELGLMGSLPVFKKDDKYYLIAGHHRTEAMKRTYGGDYFIEVIVHKYSDDNVLRGMVVENLTQRTDELMEVTDNLALIRKYLKNLIRSDAERMKSSREDGHGGKIPEPGSIREIYNWLSKNGEVMSLGKICEFLKVHDNLDKRLLENVKRVDGGEHGKEEGKLSIEDAKNLARIDKKDQFKMKEILDQTELNHKGKSKLISAYKELPEETKKEIMDGSISLTEVKDIKPKLMGNGEMTLQFHKKSTDLIIEMRTLRKTLYQFRKEKLFEHFTQKQRSGFFSRLTNVKKEYKNLIDELDNSLEVLK